MSKYPLISLFAGAGGLDIGLEMAGFSTVCANDVNPFACETLRRNQQLCHLSGRRLEDFISEALQQRCLQRLSEEERRRFADRWRVANKKAVLQEAKIIDGDIRELRADDFRSAYEPDELFCIAGGPPCQPFSRAGKRKSLDCAKNGDLFFEFVSLVDSLKPRWFIFENVKGLTFTRTDVVYVSCKACSHQQLTDFKTRQNFMDQPVAAGRCSRCGSEETDWVVRNERGGSAKIILEEFERLGYRCYTGVLNSADFGIPQTRERFFIVGSRDGLDFDWPSPTHQRPKGCQGDLFSGGHGGSPWRGVADELWVEGHPTFGSLDLTKAVLWVRNVVRPHDEPVTWHLSRPAPTVGAHQGAKLAIAPNGVPEEQLKRQQWATRGCKQGDTAPVDVMYEFLSDEELLRLQSFPAWWYLHGTRMERVFQIGNAVPPVLAMHVGRAVIAADNLRTQNKEDALCMA